MGGMGGFSTEWSSVMLHSRTREKAHESVLQMGPWLSLRIQSVGGARAKLRRIGGLYKDKIIGGLSGSLEGGGGR